MKKLAFLLLLFLPIVSVAEKNICKKITRTTDRKAGITKYTSPDLKHMTAIRSVGSDAYFGLRLYMGHDRELFNPKGATIVFADGTVFKESEIKVSCQQVRAGFDLSSYSGTDASPYKLQTFFHITPEALEKFTTKNIATIYIQDASVLVSEAEADKMRQYIKCMAEVKTQ